MNTNKPVIKTYTHIADKYDKKFESYLHATFIKAIAALKLKGGEKILDVACGTGGLESALLGKFPGLNITGIDITKPMLKIAHEKCKNPHHVRFLHMPSQKLTFEDAQFDIVITCSAFHYMRSPEKVLAECCRVLVPGGRFILIDWCRDFLWAKFYHLLSKMYKRSHYKVYTLHEMKRLCAEADLNITETETFAIPPFWRMMCVEAEKEIASRWSKVFGG